MSSSKSLSADQVKIWAETVGVHNLSEEAAEFISTAVSQKVHAIVDRAAKNASYSRRTKLLKCDIDAAMQFFNLEPTVDVSTSDYIPIRGVSGVGGRTLFVVDDKEQDLHLLVKQHTTSAPPPVSLRQHWLAVEGKQPSVPENPSLISKEDQKNKAGNPLVARKIATEKAVRKSQMIGIKDLATSDLSAEQQQYFKDVTEAVIGSNEEKRREALSSLEHDPGLHALVPRLTVFVSEGVKVNVVQQNLALLIYIMRLVRALLDNQSMYLLPYLHLIIPAVTSCVVSKMLCSRPEVDNHWALRGFAARILASICKVYDNTTNHMTQRLIQIFKDSLDDESTPLAARFGAYCALIELGNEPIDKMVIPRVKLEAELLKDYFGPGANPADKKAAEQIKERLAVKLSEFIRTTKPSLDRLDDCRAEFGPFFGQAIYDQINRDRQKDLSKRPSISGPSARSLISPQNSISSTMGSPAPRIPVPSPSSIHSLHHSMSSPVSAMSPPMFGARTPYSGGVQPLSGGLRVHSPAGGGIRQTAPPVPSGVVVQQSGNAVVPEAPHSGPGEIKMEDG